MMANQGFRIRRLSDSHTQLSTITPGPWTPGEVKTVLNYCESDVDGLYKLIPEMVPLLDFPRALLRGRYMKAVAHMEHCGIPIDVNRYRILKKLWSGIQGELIQKMDKQEVYESHTFKRGRFAKWVSDQSIDWPRLRSGRLALNENTFKQMATIHPAVRELKELRTTLSQMRHINLTIGNDDRNRSSLFAFSSVTVRNQPSSTRMIFGLTAWLRGLIRPRPGYGLACFDWGQQEFGTAAALSDDPVMIAAYESGNPYLAFAKQAKAIPDSATKETHPFEREKFKSCALAVQYGMGPKSLAFRISESEAAAQELLERHRQTYPIFWKWSDSAVDHAELLGYLQTTFAWRVQPGSRTKNPRFLRNFPMQANSAEMLRLACCFATEQGIQVCAPIHDALLIEAPLVELDDAIRQTRTVMNRASGIVLDGFILRTDVQVVRYPERYMDPRGEKMWNLIWEIVARLES